MPHLASLPHDATLMDIFKRHPQMAAELLALHESIMRHPSPFTPAEREAIAAYVSTINECRYCKGVHTNAAVELGETAENVAVICERPQDTADPRLAPILTYVGKLTSSPASVSQRDVQNILNAGWDEDAVSHAAFVAALYAFMNRLVEAHGIVGSEDYYRAGGKRLADIGYQGLASLIEESGRMTASKPSGILETALYVDDLDAAASFYGGLLKLEEVGFAEKRHVFYRCGESMLLVFNPAETCNPTEGSLSVPVHGTTGAGHMCFSATSDEIDEFRTRFENSGIEIERDFNWPNGARSLYIRDPAGNSIEFAEPSLWN